MNRMIFVALISVLMAVSAQAATVSLQWQYTEEEQARIDGFRVYMDGPTPNHIIAEVGPSARSYEAAVKDDGEPHVFYGTAYKGSRESDPSLWQRWWPADWTPGTPTQFLITVEQVK